MSAQNQSLIIKPDSAPKEEDGGRLLSFAGPGANANLYEPSPQFLVKDSARLEPAISSQKSSASADEQLTIMHESWSQHLPANQDLRNNMDVKGIISKDNPRLMAVYNTRLLRLIDASCPKAVRQQQITFKSNVSLISAHFESDYLVTIAESQTPNHLLQTVNSTEIELRRVMGEKSAVPDFIQLSLKSRVKRVRVVKTSDQRIYLLIIHHLENFVELREVAPHSGRVDPYIQFILAHQDHSTHQLIELVDVHILDWPAEGVWVCFNFAQREVKMILFEDLLLQTHFHEENPYFDAKRCSKLLNLPLYANFNQGKAFTTETRLVSIDMYRQRGTDKLVFTRESGNPEIMPHMIQVVNPYEGAMNSINIKPIDGQVVTSMYPRRILDVCSNPSVGFFVLVQEGLNVYVQMLHHDQLTVENQIQVNYQEPIKSEKVAKELLGASIITRSLDLPSEKDVSLSFTYLSCFGTLLGEMELDFGHLANIKHNTNIGMQQVLEAHKQAQRPSIISNDGLEIFRQLIKNSQFKKLAEIVGMRTQERVWICQLGGLQTVLEEALRQQLTQSIPSFLSILNYLSLVYSIIDKNQNGLDINNRRAQLIRDINYQLKRIDGIHSVYRAVLKQQIEQALENQIQAQRSQRKFNQSSSAEIASNLRRIICERVEKQANLIRLLLFFAQSDFLCYVSQCRDKLIIPKQGRHLCLEGLGDLTQKVFKDKQFPIIDLKDFMIVFDSEVLPRKTLQLIYYQVLDVSILFSAKHVDALFKQICGQMLPDMDQKAIEALWHVDNLAILQHQISPQKVLEEIIRYRDQLSHLDHLFMREFEFVNQNLPREFLLLGGCRDRHQLSNIEVLREVMNHLAPPRSRSHFGSKDYTTFIRYLKENESEIPEEVYQVIFRDYVDRVITEDLVQRNLWEQALSPRQMQILEGHLSAKHPELLVCHKIWRREISSGLGRAMSIGQGFGGAMKSESKQLANSYLATLTIGQQKQAYAESKMNKDSKMQYFTDLKDSIHLSGSKYRPGHLDFKLNTEFLFDPSSESPARRQEDEVMRPEENPQKQSKPTLSSLFFQNEKAQPKLQSLTTLQLTCPLTLELQIALTYDESNRNPSGDSHHLLNSRFEIEPYTVPYAFQGEPVSEQGLEEDENMDMNDQPIEESKNNFMTDNMAPAQFEGRQGGDQSMLDGSGEFGGQNPHSMSRRDDVSQEEDEQLLHNLSDQKVDEIDCMQAITQAEPDREHIDEDLQQPQPEKPSRYQNFTETIIIGGLEVIDETSKEDQSQSNVTTTQGAQGILNHSQTYPVNLNQSSLSVPGLPRTQTTEVAAQRLMSSEPHRHSQEGTLITQEIQAEQAIEENPPNMSPNQHESSANEKSSIDSPSDGDRK